MVNCIMYEKECETPAFCKTSYGCYRIWNKQQETKMTREDAFRICVKFGYSHSMVNLLEALGLLKCDEKAEVATFCNLQSSMTMDQLSALLNKYGYKIVKA